MTFVRNQVAGRGWPENGRGFGGCSRKVWLPVACATRPQGDRATRWLMSMVFQVFAAVGDFHRPLTGSACHRSSKADGVGNLWVTHAAESNRLVEHVGVGDVVFIASEGAGVAPGANASGSHCSLAFLLLGQRFDLDVAERDRIAVTCETEEARGEVFSRMGGVRHVLGDGGEVGREDHVAVQFDLDG